MKYLLFLSILLVVTPLKLWAQASPGQPASVCEAGDRALAQKDYELARTEYEKCFAGGEVQLETLSNLGMVYAQLGRFDDAVKAYTGALALDQESPPVHMNLGLAYMKMGRTNEAATEFARSLMGDPKNPKAQELLALCHYQLNQYALAAVEATRALDAVPDEPSASFLLGSAYLRLGLYKHAIPLLYLAAEKTNSPDVRVTLGEALLGVKAYRQSLLEFSKAQQLSPKMKGLHSELGTANAGLGDVEKAAAEFEKELAVNPDDFQATYYLGRLKRINNDPEGAAKFLAKADQLRPGDPSVQYEYVLMALQARDYAKAETLLLTILQQVPSYTDARVLLSEVYYKSHRPQEGAREKALVGAMHKVEQAELDAEGKARQDQPRKAPPATGHHP